MRAYVSRRGHVGFRFGCLGTVVVGGLIVLAAEAAVGLLVLAAGGVLVALAVREAVRLARGPSRTGLRLYRSPRMPRHEVRYVERDRWPYAVREGSWLDRCSR
jgi:hypothetical protein